ncbi:MAG: DNA replication and repair protein RecF [Bacteroidaceae bacterium]|nr:DNA replication and repair protein RecF [Bacteroidaceae bacterium]MBR6600991.1 DNA replication and repair protein RecF [Bacteroidaceae bacterium]
MILKRLSLLNYKNIEQADLDFSPKVNCFIGLNGMGKTNLLDAIYYLSFCKSASNPIDSQVMRHDSDFFVAQGLYETEQGAEEEIYCGMKRRQKKTFKRNKKAYQRFSEHVGFIPLVMVSPSDGELIIGGSEERRRFMDVAISQHDKEYLTELINYDKALQQRNALLKQEEEPDAELLSLWEEMMARSGEVIYRKRQAFIAGLTPIFQAFYAQISGEREEVSLTYLSHGDRGNLLDVIRDGRAKDRIMGYSLHGIHKDDLAMQLGGYPIKREGSQGQNKTYLIALKLAQFDFLRRSGQTVPILLLDDIFDRLDASRVEQIIRLVSGDTFGQIFITDVNRGHLDRILASAAGNYKLYDVSEGVVTLNEERL